MRIPPRDPKNYLRLKSLPADKAIRFYLGMSLSIGKDVIEDILAECMLDEVSVEECNSRLIEGLVKYGD